ncbi:MAG: SDR family oxidoreductase [Bacteroidetes bacterium]|jgi:nucleoside-diphosphate-sugar epimerase|nr:SDR family oxidoreductase [Bacteroidota bacterium]MBT7995304.1 SDR family oxidoreductase [Bacteroidota bacterium]
MKYLITGGAGFIGSNIVEELLKRGEIVKVLDNFSTGQRSNLAEFINHPNLHIIEGDVRSFHIVRKAFQDVDYVLHQGALSSVPRSINDPITSNEVNIHGTLNILEAAKEFNIKRVVFAGSSSVYGENPTLPKDESLALAPVSPYGITKYAAERYFQVYHKIFELETVVLRYFNVFGPKQDPMSEYSAVIPKFIKLIMNDQEPVIYGDGLQSRDFTFVLNNVHANILACKASDAAGEVFNIACGARYTLIDLVNGINDILGKQIEPKFDNNRQGDVKHSLADISKAQSILKYKVEMDFFTGLEKTVEYYLKQK